MRCRAPVHAGTRSALVHGPDPVIRCERWPVRRAVDCASGRDGGDPIRSMRACCSPRIEVRAHQSEALEVVDVLEFGDDDRRRIAQALAQPGDVHRVAGRERAQLGGRDGHALGQRGTEVGGDGGREPILGRLVDAVDHEPAERHARLAQLAVEVDRLLDRVVARGGDDQEGRRGVREQGADAPGALGEAVDHAAERAEERRQVAQQVDAGDALQDPEDDAGAAAEQLARTGPPGAGTSGSRGPGRSSSAASGASRKSSALRDGGVSSTSTSHSPDWSSS